VTELLALPARLLGSYVGPPMTRRCFLPKQVLRVSVRGPLVVFPEMMQEARQMKE